MRYVKYKLSWIADSECSMYNTVQYGEKPFAGQYTIQHDWRESYGWLLLLSSLLG